MIKRFYSWLYRITALPDERGEYSGGRWEALVRSRALELCRGATGKALEIGFGSGLFTLKLASQEPGLDVWGIDNNSLLLAQVLKKAADRKLVNLRLAIEDAKRLSFADGMFDRVICVNLFLNIGFEPMAAILKEMKRVCSDTGRLIFEFRNSRNLFFVLKYRLSKYYDDTAPYPLYTYSPEKIAGLLSKAGLKVKSKIEMGFPVKRYAPIVIIEAVKT
jgi:ubiquinone/menaquinone biosynthesis C-methylase UbiE